MDIMLKKRLMGGFKRFKSGIILRLFLVLFLIISLLLLSSCSGRSSTKTPTTTNYRTGTEGIYMRFLPNAPPSRVYEGNGIQFMIEIQNRGAYPQDGGSFEGYLVFSGPTDAAINVGSKTQNIPSDLMGRSYVFPDGGITTVSFEDNDVRVPGDAEKYTAPVVVTACYKYQTLASPTVCIDPDPYTIVNTVKACRVQENVPISGGQGGPVVVSRIEQHMSENEAIFRIWFRNAGYGQVVKKTSLQKCVSGDLELEDVDRINVYVSTPSLGPGDCTPSGEVQLVNGQGLMTCRFSMTGIGGSAFTEQMRILIDYAYSQSIRTQVDIINVD